MFCLYIFYGERLCQTVGFKVKELKGRTNIFSRAPNFNAERLWCNLQALRTAVRRPHPCFVNWKLGGAREQGSQNRATNNRCRSTEAERKCFHWDLALFRTDCFHFWSMVGYQQQERQRTPAINLKSSIFQFLCVWFSSGNCFLISLVFSGCGT